jgi:hypothetical protein
MNQRNILIEKLVKTGHLNVPERLALRTEGVLSSEVAEVITRVLEITGFFPEAARPWTQGEMVHERALLQRSSESEVRLIQQRADPVNPTVLREQKITDFVDAKSAIEGFIKAEWPTNIDGIKIVWSS